VPTNASRLPDNSRRSRGGFPLTSLALMVTVLACLLVSADMDRWHKQYAWLVQQGRWSAIALFAAAGLFGGIVGLSHAMLARLGWRMWLIAPFSGALAGESGVLVLMAAGDVWKTILAISILFLTVILLRLSTD
jgi:hypothetical protein